MKNLFLVTMCLALALAASAQRSMPEALQKLLNAEYAITSLYVDTVNEDKLVEDAIRGMLENLDPHSSYTDAKETKELEEPLQGEFSGVGIQFNMNKDTLYVIQTVPGGPSERVGILAGDRIIYVNDTVIAGVKMKNSDIQKRLRGKKGTQVTVKVMRPGVPELITFRITRDNIPLHSIDAKYMLDERTGYLSITRFGAKTHEEMMEALSDLKKQGMTQVIIDLSDNGGGYLNAAIDMWNGDNSWSIPRVRTSPAARPMPTAGATTRTCTWLSSSTSSRPRPPRFLPVRCRTGTAQWLSAAGHSAKAWSSGPFALTTAR